MKKCSKCKEIKDYSDFYKDRRTSDGLYSACAECNRSYRSNEYMRKYRKTEKSIEYRKEYVKIYSQLERFKINQKQYRLSHKKERAEWHRNRMKNNVNYRLACHLRSRIWRPLKGLTKGGSAVRDLGCTISELKFYLEGKFTDGMTWKNHSRNGWHIDHIIPLAFFDLTDCEQLLKACHYTNLQPLWAHDNRVKMNKLPTY